MQYANLAVAYSIHTYIYVNIYAICKLTQRKKEPKPLSVNDKWYEMVNIRKKKKFTNKEAIISKKDTAF